MSTSSEDSDIEVMYFGAPNRGCLPRLALYAGDVSFKDTVVSPQLLEELKAQGKAVFGSLPLMIHGGTTLAQSQAIAVYCAEIAGVIAPTPLTRAKDSMITNTLEDVSAGNIKIQGGPEEEKDTKIRALLDKFLPPIEAMLPEIGSFFHGGDRPTLGDLAIFAITSYSHPKFGPTRGWVQHYPDWGDRFPKMIAIRDRVRTYPTLTPYFEKWGQFHIIA